jgi:hypothetical protein
LTAADFVATAAEVFFTGAVIRLGDVPAVLVVVVFFSAAVPAEVALPVD